jgi:hypothetical protein
MKRRTEVTLEMERWIVVSRPGKRRWCSECALHVEMMTIDDAALLAQVSSRTIFRWAESGALHASETPQGLLLVCPNSPNLKV